RSATTSRTLARPVASAGKSIALKFIRPGSRTGGGLPSGWSRGRPPAVRPDGVERRAERRIGRKLEGPLEVPYHFGRVAAGFRCGSELAERKGEAGCATTRPPLQRVALV